MASISATGCNRRVVGMPGNAGSPADGIHRHADGRTSQHRPVIVIALDQVFYGDQPDRLRARPGQRRAAIAIENGRIKVDAEATSTRRVPGPAATASSTGRTTAISAVAQGRGAGRNQPGTAVEVWR